MKLRAFCSRALLVLCIIDPLVSWDRRGQKSQDASLGSLAILRRIDTKAKQRFYQKMAKTPREPS